MADYLFVYGTLRKNFDLKLKDRVREHWEYVGQAKVGAVLYDLGRYPGAVKTRAAGEGKDEVIGDVFLLSSAEKALRILDKYEGIPLSGDDGEFIRKKGKVRLRSGQELTAWIYWYNRDPAGKTKIRYKNYLNYLKNKSIR